MHKRVCELGNDICLWGQGLVALLGSGFDVKLRICRMCNSIWFIEEPAIRPSCPCNRLCKCEGEVDEQL